MFRKAITLLLLLLNSVLLPASQELPLVDHDLQVNLTPASGGIEVEDKIQLAEPTDSIIFILHAGLELSLASEGAQLKRLGHHTSGAVSGQVYRVLFHKPQTEVKLRYAGRIQHPRDTSGQNGSDSHPAGTPGDISEQGVFLSAASLWYPRIPKHLVTFSMRLTLPAEWHAVTQGVSSDEDTKWQEHSPQDEIYLIAAPFHRYKTHFPAAEAQVYLRSSDPELAERYLQATGHYLELYQRLIGPYPYGKFALVENDWESGYGMPSFTLLGPRVLRFPFILNSSYPHEILHNWWGNGVYVDYRSGNWSEGLTTYLADHLIKEQQGEGAAYRRDTLQRYADFVHSGDDFPLTEFQGRHGEVSQAVGYGKTLMILHMLRIKLGEEIFLAGVRRFYHDNLYRFASFDDLREAFEAAGQVDLKPFFVQWTRTSGAPDLNLSELSTAQDAQGHYHLRGLLQQVQPGTPFELEVLLAIQTTQTDAIHYRLMMTERAVRFDIQLEHPPLLLSVDPDFDLFRRLAEGETPSSISQLFGAELMTLILPSTAGTQEKAYLQRLAEAWSGRWKQSTIVWDDKLNTLPQTGAVLLFGNANRFAKLFFQQLADQTVSLSPQELSIEQQRYALTDLSFALTAAHPTDKEHGIGLVSIASTAALNGFARKLPHYGKYSYTLFRGDAPDKLLAGQWQRSASALNIQLTAQESPPPLHLRPRKALSELPGL
ncbi:MAG: M1 family peptidase [Gammaproteobacteria bacterium]|nr:M1 family peptidase [Gammaproteobacteria bacterium]